MGGAIPGLVLLGFIRKQDEQSIKHYPSMSSASALASRFLPWLPSVTDFCKRKQTFASPFHFILVISALEILTRHTSEAFSLFLTQYYYLILSDQDTPRSLLRSRLIWHSCM